MKIKYIILLLLISSVKLLASGNTGHTLGMPLNSLSLQETDKVVEDYKLEDRAIQKDGIFNKIRNQFRKLKMRFKSNPSNKKKERNRFFGAFTLINFGISGLAFLLIWLIQKYDLLGPDYDGWSLLFLAVWGMFFFFYGLLILGIWGIINIIISIIERKREKKKKPSSQSKRKPKVLI